MTVCQLRAVPLIVRPSMRETYLESIVAALPVIRYTRNGGIRFFRFGRLQFSFCICKA